MGDESYKFHKEHLWFKAEGDTGMIGITDYAQQQLGDIVYVDLPDEGDEIKKDESLGEVESAKTLSDLIAPVSGEVIEVNNNAVDDPSIINKDPMGEGWLLKVKLSNPSELDDLLSEEDYKKLAK
ncbi:MAG: glycine cleavage system protein GcvH [Candidatus Aminicenantes bacterium]|nr:glycine cleavage system protein GcvH [Candidatus Aminicenantes bacterium]MDH5714862.1 glycine cleavage system protein GcvH [Candidatus Aminicenantes bacterium]